MEIHSRYKFSTLTFRIAAHRTKNHAQESIERNLKFTAMRRKLCLKPARQVHKTALLHGKTTVILLKDSIENMKSSLFKRF
jgi:hypothetical protein